MKDLTAMLVLMITIVFLVAILNMPVWAQSPEIKLSFMPDVLKLPSKGGAQTLVVARNTSSIMLHNIQISWFSNTRVNVMIEKPIVNNLVPKGAHVWTIRVSQIEEERVEGNVYFRVDYVCQKEPGAIRVPNVAVGFLRISPLEPEAPEKVAEVHIKTSLSSLMEHRPGILNLIVTNTSVVPIKVTKILQNGPRFVSFVVPVLDEGEILAPRESHIFPIQVITSDVVQPGKHILLVEVMYEWVKAGRTWTGKSIATHEVEAGILGETAILTVLGIPSFLMLPGFLMILALGMLWKYIRPKKEFPIKIKTPQFWLCAITLSLITALVYPIITGWFGLSRNLLEGYGLKDVMRIWFASIIFTVAAYFIISGLINTSALFIHLYKKKKIQKYSISKNDTPIEVLKKIGKQKLSVYLECVDVKIGEKSQRAYLLENRIKGKQKIWVGPKIVIENLRHNEVDFQEKIRERLKSMKSVLDFVSLLERGINHNKIHVSWEKMDQLKGPRQVKTNEIEKYYKPKLIIIFE